MYTVALCKHPLRGMCERMGPEESLNKMAWSLYYNIHERNCHVPKVNFNSALQICDAKMNQSKRTRKEGAVMKKSFHLCIPEGKS